MRAERRGRTVDATSSRPAVVWGRTTASDAASAPAAPVEVASTAEELPAPEPLTRRRARAVAQAGDSTFTAPAEPEHVTQREPELLIVVDDSAEPQRIADTDAATSTATEAFELIEPAFVEEAAIDEEPAVVFASEEQVSSAAPAIDEFEAAARLFSFTGETPIQAPRVEAASGAPESRPVDDHVRRPQAKKRIARRASRGSSFKRVAATSFTLGVMGVVGLVTVGMTTPAEAVAAARGTSTSVTTQAPAGDVVPGSGAIQAYVAPAEVQNVALDRTENYQTGTLVELAGTTGIKNVSSANFTNNANCAIQWPFAVGVTMSYGFGMRSGTMHEGVDFTPGDGAHVQAIADGVVRISTDSGGAYGVTIVIDHVVDGQLVSSRYGHMQYGSRQVQVGQTVKVGEYIGRTGDTGRSYGAHTHVEILMNGTTPIDPLPWLRSHATC